jgi:type I restriction enzyme, R subunit
VREHRTPNIEHRSEEKRKKWTNPALPRLNPDLPVEAIEGAVEETCRDFFLTALSLAEANREIDKLLKQGVKVSFPDREHGG